MSLGASERIVDAPPRLAAQGMTHRGLIRAGLGLAGFAEVLLPNTTAYAAAEAAHDVIVTNYRLRRPGRPAPGHHRHR